MSQLPFHGDHIWIIGASSGIGRALAETLSAQGATLTLSARRQEALEALCGALGEAHRAVAFDAAEPGAARAALATILAQSAKIDRIVYLPALYDPMKMDELDMPKVAEIITTNLTATFAFIDAVLPYLKQRNAGQLALCGSIAGYVGLPNGQPYSATKSAVINLVESLRAECPKSIDIKLISPGFVRTELTAKNRFPMPFILEPAKAADCIATGLHRRAFEIHFPKRFTLLLKLVQALPYCLKNPILRAITP